MPRFNVYYAMLVTAQHHKTTSETRYFTGHSRKVMHQVLETRAKEACGNATCNPLETGIWSIHDHKGNALEAHTYCSHSSARWRTVGKTSLPFYNLNTAAFHMLHFHTSIINEDGTITKIYKE